MFLLKQKVANMIGLLLLLTFIGCNSDKQWIEKSYYENGTLKSEVEMVGDEPHGVGKYYYPSGQLELQTSYKEGLRHGEYKKYYESGKLQKVTEFRDGRFHGWQRTYYESGKEELKTEFVDGQPGSYSIHLTESGDTLSFYADGRAISFFDNGKVEQIICSENHEFSSIRSIRFSPDGRVIKREEPLYCLTSRDSLLLDEQYSHWKTAKVVLKGDTE